jgi:xylulokinase
MGFSAAAHHGVVVDKSGTPIFPCILLSDGRSARQAARLSANLQDEIFDITGNTPAPAWTLAHFLWLAEHQPDLWARKDRIMFAKDYVRWRLTGDWYTDRIEAEGSLLYDRRTESWSERLCELVGLTENQLPPIVEARTMRGVIDPRGEVITTAPAGTPVVAGCSDTAAEAYAAGAAKPDDIIVKLATAGNVNRVTDRRLPDRRLISYSYLVAALHYQCLATAAAALSVKWLHGILGTRSDYSFAEMDDEASRVPAGSAGILYHPYLSGERAPHWNTALTASFTGLTAEHGRAHLIRAVYEGVAFSLRECLDIFRRDGIDVRIAHLVGGGSKSPVWSQIVADVLAVPMIRPGLTEASAGAALLAAEGLGQFSDVPIAPWRATPTEVVLPVDRNVSIYDDIFGRYTQLTEGVSW